METLENDHGEYKNIDQFPKWRIVQELLRHKEYRLKDEKWLLRKRKDELVNELDEVLSYKKTG